jgi:hypothetical protein
MGMRRYLPFMKEMLAIFLTESCKSWSDQHKLDRIEKITFPRAISPNDDIVFGAGGGKQIKEKRSKQKDLNGIISSSF